MALLLAYVNDSEWYKQCFITQIWKCNISATQFALTSDSPVLLRGSCRGRDRTQGLLHVNNMYIFYISYMWGFYFIMPCKQPTCVWHPIIQYGFLSLQGLIPNFRTRSIPWVPLDMAPKLKQEQNKQNKLQNLVFDGAWI